MDRHEHLGQGFYVATRLGDFVSAPVETHLGKEVIVDDEKGGRNAEVEAKGDPGMKAEGNVSGVLSNPNDDRDCQVSGGSSNETTLDDSVDVSQGSACVKLTAAELDAVSSTSVASMGDTTAPASNNNRMASSEDIESDILSAVIPECGVPIPSVMAKIGKRRSKGGMLLPWHSTRSIQNYHYGGRRKSRGSQGLHSSRSREGSIFSISSVHTFRG